MKLEVVMLAGNESKQFLASLTEQIDRLEKLQSKGKVSKATEADEDTESDDEDEDEDFAPKKSKKSKFEDDEEDEEESDDAEASSDDEDEEEEEEAPKKAAKSKKITSDDINDLCKAYATRLIKKGRPGPEARKEIVKLLKKNFGVSSVTDLEPEQYAKAAKVFA